MYIIITRMTATGHIYTERFDRLEYECPACNEFRLTRRLTRYTSKKKKTHLVAVPDNHSAGHP